jgi:hypothetical protein
MKRAWFEQVDKLLKGTLENKQREAREIILNLEYGRPVRGSTSFSK